MSREINCEWMKSLNMAEERLHMRACSFECLTDALYLVGNSDLAEKMEIHVVVLKEIEGMVKKAKDDAFNEILTLTQQASANLLNMALAMADKEKE